MIRLLSEHLGFLEWAAVLYTHPQEALCGDAYVVKEREQGVLFCVVDGLGHGEEAAAASEAAVLQVCDNVQSSPQQILSLCHNALRTTRGAVLSLAALDNRQKRLSWTGVGNVEGVLFHQDGSRDWLPLRSGIVGCRMPSIHVAETPLSAGDLLLMFSDGIFSRFTDQICFSQSPAEIAELVFDAHARRNDDAVILVAKYYGDGHSVE